MRTSGPHAGTPAAALHQGHERLATVESLVDGRQVPDLERDRDGPGRAREHDDARRCRVALACTRPTENNEAADSLKPLTKVPVQGHCMSAVAEDVQPEEHRELGDQRHRADGGKNAVLALKAACGPGEDQQHLSHHAADDQAAGSGPWTRPGAGRRWRPGSPWRRPRSAHRARRRARAPPAPYEDPEVTTEMGSAQRLLI